MKNKLLKLFIISLCLCAVLFTVTACKKQHVHSIEIDNAVAATCTESGLTEGKHCSVCEEVLVEQEIVEATGHNVENRQCTACSFVVTHQIVSAYDNDLDDALDVYSFTHILPEKFESDDAVHVYAGNYDSSLTSSGIYRQTYGNTYYWYISTTAKDPQYLGYKVTVAQAGTYEMAIHIRLKDASHCGGKFVVNAGTDNEYVFEISHAFEDEQAVSNARLDDLTTQSSYMFDIKLPLVAGENTIQIYEASKSPNTQFYKDFYFIKAADQHFHMWTKGECTATCTEDGLQYYACKDTTCTKTKTETAQAGHSEVIDAAVAATCTKTGLTEGKHCSVCEEVIVEQEIVDKTAHPYNVTVTHPTETSAGNITYKCTTCEDSYEKAYVAPIEVALKSSNLALIGYTKTTEELVIPEYYMDGDALYRITSLGSSLFSGSSNLTSVTIPASVTSIDNNAFKNCSNLSNISIPSSVTSIGSNAFNGCKALTSVTIPSGVTIINTYTFSGCSALTSVTIPDSVTTIDNYAFNSCVLLASITIPSGVTTIGNNAFYSCKALTSVVIPDSVTSIGVSAFNSCTQLASVTLSSELTMLNFSMFQNCSSLKSVVIPDGVTSIKNYVFDGCSELTSVTIPNSVTSMSDYVFRNCSKLTSITLPSALTSIGSYVFSGCSELSNVTIPSSVTSIGNSAFYGCSKLSSITLPSGVTKIDNSAFYGCSELSSITLPSSLTSIGNYVFYGCSKLSSITIPAGVTSIGNCAFVKCTALTAITVDSNNASFIAVDGILYSKDGATLVYYPEGKSDTNYTVSNTVTAIGNYAFYENGILTSITLPSGVKTIGNSAFYGCSKLTSITLPNTLTSIDNSAFSDCGELSSITIPEGISSIGNSAFYGCSKLTSVTLPSTLTSIGNYAFSDCVELTEIVIPNGVTSIGNSAFANCSKLTSVTLPSTLTTINASAFKGCGALTSITFSGTVEQWDAVTKKNNWMKDAPIEKIICSNGEVEI